MWKWLHQINVQPRARTSKHTPRLDCSACFWVLEVDKHALCCWKLIWFWENARRSRSPGRQWAMFWTRLQQTNFRYDITTRSSAQTCAPYSRLASIFQRAYRHNFEISWENVNPSLVFVGETKRNHEEDEQLTKKINSEQFAKQRRALEQKGSSFLESFTDVLFSFLTHR